MKKFSKFISLFFYYLCLMALTNAAFYFFVRDRLVVSRYLLVIAVFINILNFSSFFILMWRDLYRKNYHYYLLATLPIVLKNILISFMFTLVMTALISLYVVDSGNAGRVPVSYYLLISLGISLLLLLLHGLQYLWIRHLSRLGFFEKNVLIVGKPDDRFPISGVFQDVGRTKKYLGRIERIGGCWQFHDPASVLDTRHFGSMRDILNFMIEQQVNEILLFISDKNRKSVAAFVDLCFEIGIGYYLVPDISMLPNRFPWTSFSHIPIIDRYCIPRDSLTKISVKRLFDIAFSALVIVGLLPVWLVIALAIYLEDKGPVFYISDRVGIHGRKIKFIKFRTMIKDADREKEKLMQFNERSDGPLFKMTNDPRITKVGRLLRRFSIDEFPQFLNVFLGDMSVIGPRPHLPEEVAKYAPSDLLRLECIPGISCLPQIEGRNTLSFRQWVDYDLEYRRRWDLRLDFHIFIKTIGIVLSPFLGKSENAGK